MTAEELLVSHLVQTLPEHYRKELRNGLRVLHPNKDKAAFTVDEVRSVFNNTIAVIQEDNTSRHKSTLGFHSESDQDDIDDKKGRNTGIQQAQNTQPPNTGDQTPFVPYEPPRHTPQSYAQGRTQEQQPLIHSETSVWCSLCYNKENEDYAHHTHQCPYFPTSQEKREVFITTGRCPDCARPEHQGVQCPWHLSCDIHPGERHYTWLCYGQNTRDDTS